MDIKKYINSGILETYVLGICSEKEAIKLNLLSKKYPQILNEIIAIETTLLTHIEQTIILKPNLFTKYKLLNGIEKQIEKDSSKQEIHYRKAS